MFRRLCGMPSLHSVVLTAEEEELFQFLLRVVEHTGSGTTMRVAGGWVRDKVRHRQATTEEATDTSAQLLGKPSNDIDIAVDNLSGKDFRGLIYTYLAEAAELAAAGGSEVDVNVNWDAATPAQRKRKHLLCDASLPAAKRAVTEARLEKGVITARPEKGKHIECTTLRTHGFDLDLLSLRSNAVLNRSTELSACEDVSEEEELLLLAHEDAHLRDFTVSALFYNINTGAVEDFVGVRQCPPLLRRAD